MSEEEEGGIRAEAALSLEGVARLRLNVSAGKLRVLPLEPDGGPSVTSVGHRSPPRIEVSRDGDVLTVQVHQLKGWLFRRKHGAATTVRLPDGLERLTLEVGFGEVEIRGLSAGRFDFNAGAGSVVCEDLHGAIDGSVGAGRLSIRRHHGRVTCDTGTGDVVIDLAEVAEGETSVDAGIGRVEVALPEGADVQVKAKSGLGKVRLPFPTRDGAPSVVSANTGVGEVVVRQRESDGGAGKPPSAKRGAGRSREAEQMRVLQLLEQGKITSQEAAELIAALQGAAPPPLDEEPEDKGQ